LLLDRLLGGRVFIAAVGLLLVGVVATNVGVLQLNGSIAHTGKRSATLKRENAALRIQVAKLASSERIQRAAVEEGLVLPPPGEVRYLRSRGRLDPEKAANHITKPQLATTPDPVAVTPPAVQQAAPATQTAQPATTPPAATTTPPAATAPPAAPAQAQTPTGLTTP
jgi:cell division protein FtsL